jgi:type VI secretion system protein VasD
MRSHRTLACFVWLTAALAAASCAKAPPPAAAPAPVTLTIAAPPDTKVKTSMTISASVDANPDGNGRPSPVVVRVYQLKTDGAFNAAPFADLFENEEKVLGPELISRDEYVLAPKESRTIDVAVSGDTRFVGAIAAFRDIRNSQWRMLVPAPRKGLTVAVERARVVVSPVN